MDKCLNCGGILGADYVCYTCGYSYNDAGSQMDTEKCQCGAVKEDPLHVYCPYCAQMFEWEAGL